MHYNRSTHFPSQIMDYLNFAILYTLKNKRIRLYSEKTLKYALIFHLRLFLKDLHPKWTAMPMCAYF